jgi:hypothetical protein
MRINTRNVRRVPGQAMAEFVIWVFVLLLMIEGILWFGKAYELKLQCHLASRYLAWSHANRAETDLDEDEILTRAQAYYPFTERNPSWQELEAEAVFDPNSLNEGGPAEGGFDALQLMNGMFSMASNTKGWEVGADYAPDGILDQTLPGGTHVRSRHYVSGGAWHKKQISGDGIIMIVKSGLMAWSVYALSQY